MYKTIRQVIYFALQEKLILIFFDQLNWKFFQPTESHINEEDSLQQKWFKRMMILGIRKRTNPMMER